MRTIGLILLFGGFFWLSWSALRVRPLARAVIVAHYERLPKSPDATYSREDMERAIRESTIDVADKFPLFIFPGLTMLAGGLMLAFTSRVAGRDSVS